MTSMKISTLIISIVLIALFAAGFGLFISDATANYGVTYNNSAIASFSDMRELNNLTEDLRTSVTETSGKTGVLDILGDFFSAGYKSVKISFASMGISTGLITNAMGMIDFGGLGSYITSAIITILVIVFIFIVISTLVKREE